MSSLPVTGEVAAAELRATAWSPGRSPRPRRPANTATAAPATIRRRVWVRRARIRSRRLIRRRGAPDRHRLRTVGRFVVIEFVRHRRSPHASVPRCGVGPASSAGFPPRRPGRSSPRWPLARTPASRSDRWAVDGGQPFVGQPHRHRGDPRGERVGDLDGVLRRGARPVGQRARQPDDDLDDARTRRPAAASRRRCLPVRSRRTVSTGVARMPSGSLTATPIRTVPTSTPRRRPRPGSSDPGPVGHAVLRGAALTASSGRSLRVPLPVPRRCRAASLPEPCARSALPPPRPSTAAPICLTRSLARRPASWAAGLTATTNGTVSLVTLGDQHHHARARSPACPDVADQGAQIARRSSRRHPLRHETDLTDLLGARGRIRRRRAGRRPAAPGRVPSRRP